MFNESEPNFGTSKELPEKSKKIYLAAYENFMAWRKENSAISFSEEVLLTYFKELSAKYKPSYLRATYSMLKPNLMCNHDVNMKKYSKLLKFISKMTKGYVGKKPKRLTMENVEKFIDEAPDEKYLATKVALILSVSGNIQQQELPKMTTNNIENHGEVIIVKLPKSIRRPTSRNTFVIEGKYYNIVKKYQSFRTDRAPTNRFFQQFRDGQCRAQPIGRNKFGRMTQEIAQFLKLPDPKAYNGHSLRKPIVTSECKKVVERCTDELLPDPKPLGHSFRKATIAAECLTVDSDSCTEDSSNGKKIFLIKLTDFK